MKDAANPLKIPGPTALPGSDLICSHYFVGDGLEASIKPDFTDLFSIVAADVACIRRTLVAPGFCADAPLRQSVAHVVSRCRAHWTHGLSSLSIVPNVSVLYLI